MEQICGEVCGEVYGASLWWKLMRTLWGSL
jgi:hypothetical protein